VARSKRAFLLLHVEDCWTIALNKRAPAALADAMEKRFETTSCLTLRSIVLREVDVSWGNFAGAT
jgi:hypothetical protein